MRAIETELTRLLGMRTPIIEAPMAGASGGALAAQVSLAGGFGFLNAGYGSPDELQREITTARNILNIAENTEVPIGVGFLVWQLEKDLYRAEKLLSVALSNQVRAIWLAFGEDIGRWIIYIRSHDQNSSTKDAVKIFVQISTVEQALISVNEWKADVIVAQGNEAGGHGLSSSLPILTLLPLLADVISSASGDLHPPPVLAAGGLATGAQIAALLTLGAAGVVLGTRFLLSPESLYTDSQRQALISADSSKSVRTMAFDQARNTLGWPKGVDGRGLRNDTVIDYEDGVDLDTIREKFTKGVAEADSSRMVVWSGSGVGLMKKVMPALEIVNELHEECVLYLQKAQSFVHID